MNPIECTTPSSLLPAPIASVTRPAKLARCSLVLHVEFEQRGLCRQPVGDALNQPQPVEPGEHQLGALLLGYPCDVKRDRRVGDDSANQNPFAVQQSCHVRPCVVSVAHTHAAVDRDDRTGDIARILGSQEADHPGDLGGGADPLRWDKLQRPC